MGRGLQPKRAVQIGGEDMILRGNLAAMDAYEEISGGYDLFDAFEKIRDRLDVYDKTGKSKRIPAGLVADLIWSFSATWRMDTGLEEKDDLNLEPKVRDSFRRLSDQLGLYDYLALSPIIMGLMLDVFTPPIDAGTESAEDGARPEAEDSPITTGT